MHRSRPAPVPAPLDPPQLLRATLRRRPSAAAAPAADTTAAAPITVGCLLVDGSCCAAGDQRVWYVSALQADGWALLQPVHPYRPTQALPGPPLQRPLAGLRAIGSLARPPR